MKTKRFLIIKLDGIGDFALALPALRGLINSNPGCQIDAVFSSFNKGWREVVPWIRNFYSIDFRGYRPDEPRRMSKAELLLRLVSLTIRLRARRYDAAFDLRSTEIDWRGKVIAWLSGAPFQSGHAGRG